MNIIAKLGDLLGLIFHRFSHGTVAAAMAVLVWITAHVPEANAHVYAVIAAVIGFAHRLSEWATNATATVGKIRSGIDRFLHAVAGAVPASIAAAITSINGSLDGIAAAVIAVLTYVHHVADGAGRATFPAQDINQ